MLVVLEGCDGVGKSTIAKHIQNLMGNAEIIHCTADTTNDYDFFDGLIYAGEHRNIIADRFCYGQFVYQDEEDRALSWRELELLEEHMLSSGAKVIHVAASVNDIKDRLSLRGEKTDIPVEDICDRYLYIFEKCSLIQPYVWWNGADE